MKQIHSHSQQKVAKRKCTKFLSLLRGSEHVTFTFRKAKSFLCWFKRVKDISLIKQLFFAPQGLYLDQLHSYSCWNILWHRFYCLNLLSFFFTPLQDLGIKSILHLIPNWYLICGKESEVGLRVGDHITLARAAVFQPWGRNIKSLLFSGLG